MTTTLTCKQLHKVLKGSDITGMSHMNKVQLLAAYDRHRQRPSRQKKITGGGAHASRQYRVAPQAQPQQQSSNAEIDISQEFIQVSLATDNTISSLLPRRLGGVSMGKYVIPTGCMWMFPGDEWQMDENFSSSDNLYSVVIDTGRLIILDTREKLQSFYDVYGSSPLDTVPGTSNYQYIHGDDKNPNLIDWTSARIDWNSVRTQNPHKCGFYLKKLVHRNALWSSFFHTSVVLLWSDSCIDSMQTEYIDREDQGSVPN